MERSRRELLMDFTQIAHEAGVYDESVPVSEVAVALQAALRAVRQSRDNGSAK